MTAYIKEHKEQDCNKGVFSDFLFNKRWYESAKQIIFATERTCILIYTYQSNANSLIKSGFMAHVLINSVCFFNLHCVEKGLKKKAKPK